jgi:AAA15 family ATPase/GTPase
VEDVNWIKEPSLDTTVSGSTLRRDTASDEDRVPMITLSGREKAIPLSSFGEGTERTLWIGSAIVNSRDGMLLIDEIENGLHYCIQPKLWEIIFETAQKLNVQVFATTHSYDCLQAFQQVAEDYGSSESMLVSLRRREADPEDIVAVLSDRDELGAVVDANIEVR